MHGHHLCGTGFGWFFSVIVLISVIMVSYYIFLLIQEKRGKGEQEETAMKTLRNRYAKGEITKEEFDRIKSDLMKS
jgi:putative membrane protein